MFIQLLAYYVILNCFAIAKSFGQPLYALQNTIALNDHNTAQFHLASTTTSVSDTPYHNPSKVMNFRRATQMVIGLSKKGRPIEAYFFQGQSEKRALVIGGMHGSELSSIAIARNLIAALQEDSSNYYSVIVIPSLFPDNAEIAKQYPAQIGSPTNIGRYSDHDKPDPNRQMPPLGKAFNSTIPLDFAGRLIEKENQLLLQFIQSFNPDRILNIHAIKDIRKAGVFADPRTEANGNAIGFETDSSLAVAMAIAIEKEGGKAPGNQLSNKATAMYHSDFRAVPTGAHQKRNFMGSALPNQRGYGTSLGSWATTAVDDGPNSRKAIRLLTMEFPGCKRPVDYTDIKLKKWCQKEIDNYTSSIVSVFLKNVFEE